MEQGEGARDGSPREHQELGDSGGRRGGKKPGDHSRRGSMRRNQKNREVPGDRATLISIRQRGQEIHSGEPRQL